MLPLIMVGAFRDPNYILEIILDEVDSVGHDNNRRVFRFFNSYELEELLILRAISQIFKVTIEINSDHPICFWNICMP